MNSRKIGRRTIVASAGLALIGGAVALGRRGPAPALAADQAASQAFEVTHPEAEWRRLLTPAEFAVLREHGTEASRSSPLESEARRGVFVCAGCALPLYRSEDKFDSGTGWPSFHTPIAGAVATTEDRSLFMSRTEVHCSRCGGHLGHVFEDGPKPTGLRYCMNGAAMKFDPA